jgi:hypothetical protein
LLKHVPFSFQEHRGLLPPATTRFRKRVGLLSRNTEFRLGI